MFNSIPPFKTNIMKYKEKLEGFPEEVVEKMLERQVEQGNKRDVSVFECHKSASINSGGFYWSESEEGNSFWEEVISNKNFDVFFERYPKKEEMFMKYMMVSDRPITKDNKGTKFFVIGEFNEEYMVCDEGEYEKRKYKTVDIDFWKYAQDIEEDVTEVTIAEIAKMMRKSSDKIRIKE